MVKESKNTKGVKNNSETAAKKSLFVIPERTEKDLGQITPTYRGESLKEA